VILLFHRLPPVLRQRFDYTGFPWLGAACGKVLQKQLLYPSPTEQLMFDLAATDQCM
jgi:hypothetical protein